MDSMTNRPVTLGDPPPTDQPVHRPGPQDVAIQTEVQMPLITVVIATPRPFEAQRLRATLVADPGVRVIALCPGLMETFHAVEQSPPDVVLIARELTLTAEFEVMRALFQTFDIRWLVTERTTDPTHRAGASPLTAPEQGGDLFALDPDAAPHNLVRQVHAVTHAARRAPALLVPKPVPPPRSTGQIILIGASTGGVDALVTILAQFGADCPPTVIVQHTGAAFGAGLVQLLALRCRAQVIACRDGLEPAPGMVCIAAGTPGHAVFSGFAPPRLALHPGEPVAGHSPSIDRLFMSAVPVARRVTAAVLTGMGQDGAAGLLALRQAGATTLAQDAASSVVYGMPRVAYEIGGAERQVPLDRMAAALLHTARIAS